MYRVDDLKSGLLNLIGWRQHYDTSEFTIADSLTVTESGQYFQDIHPLVTLDNMKAIAPNFSQITYDAWQVGVQYRVGDRVSKDGGNYRAKVANIGADPVTETDLWERFDAFSEWIENKTKASISKAIQRFWSEKLASQAARSIVENKYLFDGTGRLTDSILNSSSVVGFELVPIRANGVSLRINKIGHQFKGQGTIVLYLMHSSRVDPVKVIELNQIRDGGMQWTEQDDLVLPYVSEENDAGGSWYLVYQQDELPDGMEAVNKTKDWSQKPCSSCSRSEFQSWQAWSKYLEIHPFKIPSTEVDNGDFENDFNGDFYSPAIKMWDVENNLYTYTSNYGLNLQITIECDITEMILEQKAAFQNVIGLQMAVDAIREFAYNPSFRIGRGQQNFGRLELLYELDGDSQSQRPGGLVYQLKKAFDGLDFDMQKLSRVCLPCKNGGIRYRTV